MRSAPTTTYAASLSAHDLHPDLALLLSTSGTTGSPKLVRLSRANVASNAAAIADYLALTPADRAITALPLHYSYGLSVLHSHLVAGASVVLAGLSVVDECFWDLSPAPAPPPSPAFPTPSTCWRPAASSAVTSRRCAR